MDIVKKIINFNFSSRKGSKIKYIVLHDTGNSKLGAGANNHYIYFGGGYRGQSAHYFVDSKEIIQIIEDSNSAWHVGDGNGKYGILNVESLGIEMCINPDSDLDITEKKALELTKYLMKKHNIPVERVIRHYDASRKVCPEFMKDNDWERWKLFKAQLVPQLYRVRESWDKPETQLGAYSVLITAKSLVDKNPKHSVYDSSGNLVYQGRSVIVTLKYTRLLKRGTKGEDVKQLQNALISLRYDPKGADGIFGVGCETAIKLFQKNNNLVVDGLVGSSTISKINQALNGNVVAPPVNVPKTPINEYRVIKKFNSDVHIYETKAGSKLTVELGKRMTLETVSSIAKSIIASGKSPKALINCGFVDYSGNKDHLGMLITNGLYYFPPHNAQIDFMYYKNGTTEIKNLHGYNAIELSKLQRDTYFSFGASYSLVQKGVINTENKEKYSHSKNREPRTLFGQKRDGTFLLVVVDGRKVTSLGMTAQQSASLMLELGAYNAVNLDGGGSSTLVVVENGKPVVKNKPSDKAERAIGSVIVVY